jgi:hypothetical protein
MSHQQQFDQPNESDQREENTDGELEIFENPI